MRSSNSCTATGAPMPGADQWQPPGDWLVWLLLGGRGAGKTRAGAEWVRAMALGYNGRATGPIALVGETFADVREVMIEGVSGLLGIHESGERPVWPPTRRRLEWPSGVHAQVFSRRRSGGAPRPAIRRRLGGRAGEVAPRRGDLGHAPVRAPPRRPPAPVATTTPRPIPLLRRRSRPRAR